MVRYFQDVCGKAHCATCRRTDDVGRKFRESIAKVHLLPGNDLNFACPHGFGWDAIQPPPDIIPIDALPQGVKETTMEQVEAMVSDLGYPPYLKLALDVAKRAIEAAGCTECTKRARVDDMLKKIDAWKRSEQ